MIGSAAVAQASVRHSPISPIPHGNIHDGDSTRNGSLLIRPSLAALARKKGEFNMVCDVSRISREGENRGAETYQKQSFSGAPVSI